MTRAPSTDDKLHALAERRATTQALLARALAELDRCAITSRRRDDALTLCCRLIFEIDGMSREIDVLLDRRQQERDAEKPGRIV